MRYSATINLRRKGVTGLRFHCLAAAWLACVAIGQANAETDSEQPALWELRAAVFNRYGPSYPGSDENQLNIVPVPLPIYRGRFLRLFEDNEKPLRGRLFARDTIRLELDLDLQFPSDSDEIDARTGMPDLNLLLEAGPELQIELARETLGGTWYATFGARVVTSWDGLDPEYEGLTFSPELKYVSAVTPRDELKLRITPKYATDAFMDFFYTVDPAYATAARPTFSAEGGYLGTDITGNWSHEFSDRLSFFIGLRYSHYTGATNDDSPLHVDNNGYSVYGAIQYRFWESMRRAPRKPGILD